ncbi:MAG: hypothetical protein VKS61_01475 [Candidatus Sericytochromatia bacterium]|nr:hypothetical protein [Candidatus Sericytochromatia bacterium]
MTAPRTLSEVGADMALGEAVELLLQDAEVLAGNRLVGNGGGALIGFGAANVVSKGGGQLISDGGVRLGPGRDPYALLADDDVPPSVEALRQTWQALSAADRGRSLEAHRKREARVLEAAREALAARAGGYKRKDDVRVTKASGGGEIARQTIESPLGPVLVERVEDAEGLTLMLRQTFRGTIDGTAVEAERTRHLLPDGTARVDALTTLGGAQGARKLRWVKKVAPDGTVTGRGTRTADGAVVELQASGNVAEAEQATARVEDVDLTVERSAGRNEAKVAVAGGALRKGAVAVRLPAAGKGQRETKADVPPEPGAGRPAVDSGGRPASGRGDAEASASLVPDGVPPSPGKARPPEDQPSPSGEAVGDDDKADAPAGKKQPASPKPPEPPKAAAPSPKKTPPPPPDTPKSDDN